MLRRVDRERHETAFQVRQYEPEVDVGQWGVDRNLADDVKRFRRGERICIRVPGNIAATASRPAARVWLGQFDAEPDRQNRRP